MPIGGGRDSVAKNLPMHSARITSLAIVGDYSWTGSFDGTIRVTKCSTREEAAVLQGHDDMVSCLAPDGDHVWSGGPNGMLMQWSTQPPQLVAHAVLKDKAGRPTAISSIVALADHLWLGAGRTLVVVRKDDLGTPVAVIPPPEEEGSARLAEPAEELRQDHGVADGMEMAAAPEGSFQRKQDVADPALAREDRLRASSQGKHTRTISAHLLQAGAPGEIWSCSFMNGRIHIWDVTTRCIKRDWLLDTQGISVLRAVGGTMWCGSTEGSVYIWDLHTHHPIQELRGHTDSVRSLCAVQDGRSVASGSGSHDGSIAMYRNDITTSAELAIPGGLQPEDTGRL